MTRPAMFLAVPCVALALTGCAEMDREPDIRAPAATVLGEPVSCISRSRIRDTDIHDDYTIDFELAGGETYRTTLSPRCPGLGVEERITYEVSGDRLCGTDTFTVLYSDGRRGATCGFGMFTPVRIETD